jgi:hypothetical protein
MRTHVVVAAYLHEATLLISCLSVPAAVSTAVNGQLQGGQPAQHGHADSLDSMVRALPSHISDFGESPPADMQALLTEAAWGAEEFEADAAADVSASAPQHPAEAGAVQEEDSAPHLPSHISAFGDDLGPLPGVRAVLSASEELEDGFAAGGWCAGQALHGMLHWRAARCAPRSVCNVHLIRSCGCRLCWCSIGDVLLLRTCVWLVLLSCCHRS